MLSLKQLVISWFTPSVDKVVSDFNKVVAKLQKVANFHASLAAAHQAEIDLRTQALSLATAEKARAEAVAAKIQSLLS